MLWKEYFKIGEAKLSQSAMNLKFYSCNSNFSCFSKGTLEFSWFLEKVVVTFSSRFEDILIMLWKEYFKIGEAKLSQSAMNLKFYSCNSNFSCFSKGTLEFSWFLEKVVVTFSSRFEDILIMLWKEYFKIGEPKLSQSAMNLKIIWKMCNFGKYGKTRIA